MVGKKTKVKFPFFLRFVIFFKFLSKAKKYFYIRENEEIILIYLPKNEGMKKYKHRNQTKNAKRETKNKIRKNVMERNRIQKLCFCFCIFVFFPETGLGIFPDNFHVF